VVVCRPDGTLVASSGEIDRPFFLRSSAKPFQAFVSQTLGADLAPTELAVACGSHRGEPVHVALVEAILTRRGLDASMLLCPPDWPLYRDAALRLARSGESKPRRLWHNCSGKHAAFLAACAARGWPLESYLDPSHPLQTEVVSLVSELGGYDVTPVGVDGCGAPVLRTTARAMATLFARLAAESELRPVFQVMHRYPALVGGTGAGDTAIAVSTSGIAKGGAQGCLGVALEEGLGVAVKSWDGLGQVATVGAVAALGSLGRLTATAQTHLEPFGRPPVLGGDEPVGELVPRLRLRFT
jgi:L-asparaginase II